MMLPPATDLPPTVRVRAGPCGDTPIRWRMAFRTTITRWILLPSGIGADEEKPVLITTTNDVPGYRVEEVFGEVFGLTVRSRHIGSQMGAAFKSLGGGELKGMTKNLEDSRLEALSRLTASAEALGANAIIAMRFDTTEMGGNWTEICAYGTACRLTQV